MDATALGVEAIRAAGAALVAIGGSQWLARRGRRNGAACCHHCKADVSIEARVIALDRAREDMRIGLHDIRGALNNVAGHASRLEREADEFKKTVEKSLGDIDRKLDQLLGWTQGRS